MSHHHPQPGRGQVLIFDSVLTNLGSAYNRHNGMFTAPSSGYYVLTLTTACSTHGYIYTQIVKNSEVVGVHETNSESVGDMHLTTGIVVVNANQGDVIYIRSHSEEDSKGSVISDVFRRSSFSGWRIF